MESFKFDIDTKSFFVGITNDTGGGHTATVSTNLKQGVTTKKELRYFLQLKNEINEIRRENKLLKEVFKTLLEEYKITKLLEYSLT